MNIVISTGLALLLPWGCGTLWLCACPIYRSGTGFWPMVLGYGYLLGILAATVLLRMMDRFAIPLNFTGPAIILIVVTTWIGWQRRHFLSSLRFNPTTEQPASFWIKTLWVLLLIWLAVRWINLALEVLWLPMYPWDAWSTWMVRPQAWLEWKQLVPFSDAESWLADTTGRIYHIEGWQYPLTVSLIALWSALASGQWHEAAVNSAWWGCGLALALGFYGQARLWGATALTALIFTWLLLSLPLLNAHIALAGYADLWLATVFGLAAISFMQWVRLREVRQGILALGLGLFCPTIKLEGIIWALLLLIAALAVALPKRYVAGLASVIVVAIIALLAAGGWTTTIPGLGELQITAHLIRIPGLGQLPLVYWNNWSAVIDSGFMLDNWHVFFYPVPLTFLLALWRIVDEKRADLIITTGFITLLLSAFFVLFFCTAAGQWAKDFTSINRIMLHLVPAILFWMLTVFIPPGSSNQPAGLIPAGSVPR